MKKRVTFWLDDDLIAKLDEIASAKRCTRSDLIREAVKLLIEKYG